MIAQSYRLEELLLTRHQEDAQYLNAFLMDCWDKERTFFEMYRLPSMRIKGGLMSFHPQEPRMVLDITDQYTERLNWLKEKFALIGNQDIGYFIDWEIKRVEDIKKHLSS